MCRPSPAILSILLVFLGVSCGGDGTVTPPPSGTPASISIAAGDQQQAAAGVAVAVPPAVLVRDAEQQPVSGVTVQFAVSAGGGDIQGSTAVTSVSGVARVGSWTLGTTGEQRLTASVGSLSAVTFHATIVADGEEIQTSIGSSGGAFEITTPGHPYEGLRLTIPSGTFAGTTVLRFGIANGPSLPTLPSGFRVSGPVLEVTSSQLRGSKLMTLEVPVSHGPNEQVLVAYHDPVNGVTEIMPTVYRDDTLVVVVASHLRSDLLASPALAGGAATVRGTDPVGWLMPIAYPLPMQDVPPVLSSLAERWPVVDLGSASHPNGFGPAIPIMQSLVAAMDRSFTQLDAALQTPGFYADPAQLAAVVRTHQLTADAVAAILAQYEAAALAAASQFGRLRASSATGSLRAPFDKAQIDQLANHAIVAALKFSGKPLPVALLPTAQGGAPIYATAVAGTESSVSVLAAATKAIAEVTRNAAEGFESISIPPVADQSPVAVGQVIPLSSFLVDYQAVRGTLLKLLETTAMPRGSEERDAATEQMLALAGLPALLMEAEAAVGTGFAPIDGNTVVARSTTVRIRVPGLSGSIGFSLDLPISGSRAAEVQGTTLALAEVAEFEAAADLVPTDVVVSQLAQVGGTVRQISAKLIRLIKAPFEVNPTTSKIKDQFTDLAFTAAVPRPPAQGYSIEWDWGDGHFTEIQNSAAATHEFVVVEDYEVVATLLSSPDRTVLAADTVEVVVDQAQHWQLVAFSDQDGFFSGEEIEGEDPITIPLERALANPASALISVVPLTINSSELQVRTLPTEWNPEQCCPPPPYQGTEFDMPLGRKPANSYQVGPFFAGWETAFWSESAADLGVGTMTGQHLFGTRVYAIKDEGSQVGPSGGVRITGTRNGRTMTGTISLWIWFVNEDLEVEDPPDEYRFPFVATRLR